MKEVAEDWLHAKLTQQRRNLAAMIRAVICQVLQRLPHRILVNAKIKGAVFHHTIQIVLCQSTYENEQSLCLWFPVFPQCRHASYLRNIRDAGR